MASERDLQGQTSRARRNRRMSETRLISLNGGAFDVEILERGEGDPLLYLHGVIRIDDDLLMAALARHHRVVAPLLPGFGESTGAEHLNDIHDLAIYYAELIDRLGLDRIRLVGHSLGGMFAAELAAVAPGRISHLVLMAPFGLWDDSAPTFDFFAASPQDMAKAFYSDPNSTGAMAIARAPQEVATEVDPDTSEGQAIIEHLVERVKTMSSAVRYLWPIPDRGLARRPYRLTMPTLVIWGEDDGVIAPTYADLFSQSIADARTVLIPDAAHMLNHEQPDTVVAHIEKFITA